MSERTEATEEQLSALPACPRCGSVKVAWILRGYPMFSEELQSDLASGSVILVGCVVWPGQASHQCKACALEFRSDGRPVLDPDDDW